MQDFISDLLERVESSGGNFVEHAYGILGSEIMPLLRILFVLYVGWYGVQLFMGTSRIAVSEVGLRIVRMMAILWLIGNWGNFNTLFYSWLIDTPEDAGRAILAALNTGISEPTNGLSMIWHTASGAASALSAQTSWRYILPGMVGIVVLICTGLFIGVALAILILAKVMMWVLIGTAPIFIACFLFQTTRNFAMGWINQVILYALIPLFIFVVAALMISAITPELNRLEAGISGNNLTLGDFTGLILLTLAGIFVLTQVNTLAQGIAGVIGSVLGSAGYSVNRMALSSVWRGARWGGRRAMSRLSPSGTSGAGGSVGSSSNSTRPRRSSPGADASAEAMQNRISANSEPR